VIRPVLGGMRLRELEVRVDILDVLYAELRRCRKLCGGKKGLVDRRPLGRARRSREHGPGHVCDERELGLPVVTPGERLSQVRDTVTSLRELDGPDLYTPVVMAVRGPKAQALAADLADTVTFAAMPGDSRAEMMRLAADFRATRDVELALHVPVVGDAVAPFMTPPDTNPAALRAADSLLILPSDPTAATEEILRRREDSGFSYFVVGANAADALAPVVAELTGH
jgi:alkanesulfonate monooxygenase SsuD/methylene tetrahydromethanopterin reductase-like flavin-dependent oxidoreductase (luciferase family)